jgi:hypothetical protein
MTAPPPDLDATRAAMAEQGLVAEASAALTREVAMEIPFERLGEYKTLLKRFFSSEPWSEDDAAALSELVTAHVDEGWWEHRIDGSITLTHGIRDGAYILWVSGGEPAGPALFDRVFSGPVVPEPTPHPRKVKFATGGEPRPGIWYRTEDGDPGVPRVRRLFREPDVTDVMVAGDFVTIGLERNASWEERLDDLLTLVVELFATEEPVAAPVRTRDEMLVEAAHIAEPRRAELHLLDPDRPEHRSRLEAALASDDARTRRIAVAVLAESDDVETRSDAVRRGYADDSLIVRRAAIDAAADHGDEAARDLFETALSSGDAWIRWKAVRALGELGIGPSRDTVTALADDPDFQVRFEVARNLR